MTADTANLLTEVFTHQTVIDLSLPLAENLPCTWPGHVPYRATVWSYFTDREDIPQPVYNRMGGYQTRWLVIDEHTGTHIDAPRHFIPPEGSGLPAAGPAGAVGVDQLALLCAAGPAAVIDVTEHDRTDEPGVSPRITPADLEAWEQQHERLDPGDVVLLHTGWDRRYQPGPAGNRYGNDVLITGTEPGWPAPTAEAIGWLLGRGVRCVGTDGLSIGPAENGGPTHVAGLSEGMVFIEALTHLDDLPAQGAWFLFLPIHVVDATGAPGRAIAVLPPTQ
jgi:kynurenine formamidase